MRKQWIMGVAFAFVGIAVAGAQTPVYLDDTQPLETRVQDALSRMTLAEKVALCHAQSKFSSSGVPRLGIPELWMDDGPHGVREETLWNAWDNAHWTNDSVTAFPALTCLAATWNPQMAARYGKAVGEEARYRNKNVLLGPGVNIYRTPLNGRNFEYLGEDPYLSSKMVVPYIQGLQQNGVGACVKHFALNNQETERGSIDVSLSDRALNEIYLPAFKAAITEGKAWSIMGAYNQIHGQHCCNNDFLLNKTLKGDWEFDGVVITDWGGCHATEASVLAGLDLEMGSYTNGLTSESAFTYNDYYLAGPFLKLLQEGKIPVSVVDGMATRILRLIFRTSMNRQRPYGSLTNEDHYAACREIADEGIVLLKNDGRLLPLDAARYNKILVVGENATRRLTEGGGSSSLKVKLEVSPLAALQALYGDKVSYAQGYKSGRCMYGQIEEVAQSVEDSLRAEAVARAKDADLIIYVGGLNKNHQQDCEAGDRTGLNLPFGQDALIASLASMNKPFVVTLLSGNAMAMPWVKKVPAIVQGWYCGSQAGNALVDILSGKVCPSGRLPMTFPVKLTDCGAHSFGPIAYPGVGGKEEYKEDILVGYRWFDTKKIAPLFPFGYGLSYTTFSLGRPQLSATTMKSDGSLTLSVTVKNTGKVAGKEVVQLYVQDEKCTVQRPEKELKGFQKVMLQPGESRTVTFTIDRSALAFYSETNHGWTVEPGRFKALVGASSRDIRCTAEFDVR
jgi:beta-glucosidase